ncbi:MAG: hypothetical protein KDA42_17410 [Planctomycetales bacterium]|nr:hypothetical protein [Planctomycetales bacterium]
MTIDPTNPYTAPQADSMPSLSPAPENIDPAQLKKIQAIIKDAGQFWLAILMCFFCGAIGPIIIGPWYLVRLIQWNSLAREEPLLLDPNVRQGSIAQKFQAAKIKLILGMSFGALIFVLIFVGLALSIR